MDAAAIAGSQLVAGFEPTRKEQSIGSCLSDPKTNMSGLLEESQVGAF